MQINMTEDHCCGGGHCGPLPGYNFKCPLCNEESGCRTGTPLQVGESFKCMSCDKKFEVLNINDNLFDVKELSTSNS